MTIVNITTLMELTGSDDRTIRRRLGEAGIEFVLQGKSKVVDTKLALPAIYQVATARTAKYNLTHERGRLDYHRANREELREKTEKGQLLDAGDVEAEWASIVLSVRAQLLAYHLRMAPVVLTMKTLKEIESTLKAGIDDALSELDRRGNGMVAKIMEEQTRPGSDDSQKADAADDEPEAADG